jgi:gliding-associated putative ABC transporter substrate-binding component GldG
MTKRQAATLSILVIIIIVLSLMVSRRLWFRLDLTSSKSYTISAVSRNLHNEIPDQIRITYFISDKLKTMYPMPGEIEDLLREYAGYSRGKIQVMVRDPVKMNVANEVEQLGIMPQQIPIFEQDQRSIITVYTGLLIEYLDQIEVLPVVFSLETLEYDLTSRIRSMVRGTSRLLGVIVGDKPWSWNEEYRQLQGAYMYSGYQLRLISPGEEIPETLPALLVLGGVESFDDTALYHIDRYIQSGGKALFAVKNIQVDTETTLEARLLSDGGLLSMLSTYGVTVVPEIVMDSSALPMQYQTRTPNGSIQFRIIKNPQWLNVLGENGNPSHPVSANFSGLDMFWAGHLELNAPYGIEADYLFTSTGEAWSIREPFYTNPEAMYLFERDMSETLGVKILGASLAGTFPSWFSGLPKPDVELPDMPSEARASRIIVVCDTDFATSFMNASGGTRNLDFLVQAADWLCNDDDIIGIRARASQSGRLDKIFDTDSRKSAMQYAQFINVYTIPLLVIAAGVFRAFYGRRKYREMDQSQATLSIDDPPLVDDSASVDGSPSTDGGKKERSNDI